MELAVIPCFATWQRVQWLYSRCWLEEAAFFFQPPVLQGEKNVIFKRTLVRVFS